MCEDTERIGTFIFPPGSVSNEHPIRIFQFYHYTSACPRDYYLIMASMQLSGDLEKRESELEALKSLILRYYQFDISEEAKTCESEEPSEPNEVLFAVMYLQDTVLAKHT